MKKHWLWFLLFMIIFIIGCDAKEVKKMKIQIMIGEKIYPAFFYENPTTKELIQKLPITLTMSDLYKNEKYANLSTSLPVNPQIVGMVKTGDIMLYGSDCLVLFYKNITTSYSYTKLGKIETTEDLSKILGNGSIKIVIKSIQKENTK